MARSTYFVRVNGTLAEVDDAAWVSFTWPGRKKGEKLLIDNKKKVFCCNICLSSVKALGLGNTQKLAFACICNIYF